MKPSPVSRHRPRSAPTLAEIARTAGVSKSTASRALRSHPALSAATTGRVRRVAASLGYRHSPLLGEVMRRIRVRGHFKELGQIAYLTFDTTAAGWRQQLTFRQFFDGAGQRAAQLGLQLQPFWMREPGLAPARATDILEARGVAGLIVGPTTGWTQTPELDWSRFCAVKIGTPFPDLPLPCAVHHHFGGMTRALAELARRGYRRPGLVLRDYQEAKTGGAWSAPFFRQLAERPAAERVPPLWLAELSPKKFSTWFRRHRPDVVLGQGNDLLAWLKQLGRRVPADVGFVDLDRCTPDRAGIDQRSPAIGAAAVDLLVNRLLNHDRGLPATMSTLLVEGVWIDGPTVKPFQRPTSNVQRSTFNVRTRNSGVERSMLGVGR
ncbi:MAG TPA: LacI family DNA-binding transcriptional regulator [Opitutaceae bacterium]|nr:LacI family DNA-binding transcriptional regulator [Opitutaceae bacterium]